MSVTAFENAKWAERRQEHCWRHDAALRLVRRGPVLDLGCGDGLLMALLQARGYEVAGVDISSVAVDFARARGLNVKVVDEHGPLPFEDKSFGTAVMTDVLEHLYQPDRVLAEVRRVAHELVVVVPNFNGLKCRLQVLAGRIPQMCGLHKGHVYWLNRRELLRRLSESGFDVEAWAFENYKRSSAFWRPVCGAAVRMWPALFAVSFGCRAIAART